MERSSDLQCFPRAFLSMIQVTVALPSGRSEDLSVPASSKVEDLKTLARKSFGKNFLKLFTSEGRALTDSTESLQTAGIEDGDHLTVIAQPAKLAATKTAYAWWCFDDDQIVTGGDPNGGGDSSALQHHLRRVQQVRATHFAFAAILADGSIVTWGHRDFGGDSSVVRHKLRNVQQLRATHSTFAAILADGSVVTWGLPPM